MAQTTLIGTVTSAGRDQTITVSIASRETHPLYRKQYTKTRKYSAHDPENSAGLGDRVEIIACRPYSKTKNYRLVKILEKSHGTVTLKDEILNTPLIETPAPQPSPAPQPDAAPKAKSASDAAPKSKANSDAAPKTNSAPDAAPKTKAAPKSASQADSDSNSASKSAPDSAPKADSAPPAPAAQTSSEEVA